MKRILFYSAIVCLIFASCNNNPVPQADPEFEKKLQEKLINATEGEIIELPEGNFSLTRSLILDGINNVTIRGKGKDKTTLSFKDQKDGAEGLRVTANGIVLEDFALLDAKGDNIKIQDATNVVFRRLKVGWTSVHDTENGAYAIYPVGCTNVLVEDCEVFNSADAGVYVGQSKNIIVRRNHVHDNVAGIEIENSSDADVYDNLSENNTGGILIFDLPDLPVKDGARCRVFNNKIVNNNIPNFGVKGTTVAEVPAGSGMIIMAANQCEVFNNEITGHNTMSAAIVCYLAINKPFKDSLYDPYSAGIYFHDNKIARGTGGVDQNVAFGKLFTAMFGDQVPDIVTDGALNPARKNPDGSVKDSERICIRNNGNITFSNMDLLNKGKGKTSDISQFDCTQPSLNEVKLNL